MIQYKLMVKYELKKPITEIYAYNELLEESRPLRRRGHTGDHSGNELESSFKNNLIDIDPQIGDSVLYSVLYTTPELFGGGAPTSRSACPTTSPATPSCSS